MVTKRSQKTDRASAAKRLTDAVQGALDTARKAHKLRKSLSGDNFYANKLAELRADATNAFSDLTTQSAGDTSAMAEMIQAVFSPETKRKERLEASRDLCFALKTTWRDAGPAETAGTQTLFPLGLLAQTNRGYLTAIGRQMNGCYSNGWYDASAVMMRRLLEIALIEAFEKKGIANKIKDSSGNYRQLSELIDVASKEVSLRLSRNCKKYLPKLRDMGHMSAHGRYFFAKKDDVDRIRDGCRVVVEELLHHAGLLNR